MNEKIKEAITEIKQAPAVLLVAAVFALLGWHKTAAILVCLTIIGAVMAAWDVLMACAKGSGEKEELADEHER